MGFSDRVEREIEGKRVDLVFVEYTRKVPSSDPETKNSELTSRQVTALLCPVRVSRQVPSFKSQIFTLLSVDPE